jgi:hypothetical protein
VKHEAATLYGSGSSQLLFYNIMREFCYFFILLVICLTSSIDIYFNLKYPVTVESELNPIAKIILSKGIPFLVSFKFFTNFILLYILVKLRYFEYKYSMLVASVVAAFYIFVVVWMVF